MNVANVCRMVLGYETSARANEDWRARLAESNPSIGTDDCPDVRRRRAHLSLRRVARALAKELLRTHARLALLRVQYDLLAVETLSFQRALQEARRRARFPDRLVLADAYVAELAEKIARREANALVEIQRLWRENAVLRGEVATTDVEAT